MNRLNFLRNPSRWLATPLLLTCFGLARLAWAVVPAPDGGYPNFTTAEGQNALFSLTSGAANTGVGWSSLFSDTTASFNTAVGAGTLLFNNADSNTAVGAAALLLNTDGDFNTAMGVSALQNNTTGVNNTALGSLALSNNTTASANTAVGRTALRDNTTGGANTAVGTASLVNNEDGSSNTAIGSNALANNTSGDSNVAVGFLAGADVTTASNVICIGTNVAGANVSDSCYVGHIWQEPGGSQAVYVNSDGKLGQIVSSRRFQDEIRPMAQSSEVIYALKPVSFRYKAKIEPTRPLGFGLVAEEVEKISPDLVTRDGDGQAASVRYEAVNAMLLNEFLKEHRKNEEQQATIVRLMATDTRQQKQIEALTAALQRVSAQLELNKPAPKTVLNNQ